MKTRIIGAGFLAAMFLQICAAQSVAPATLPGLQAPFRVKAGGKPIVATTGHAAPFVVDFDRDGLNDLAVGEFGGGRCRVYRNVGSAKAPQFREFRFIKAGGVDAKMASS